jgi:hypothetical protein
MSTGENGSSLESDIAKVYSNLSARCTKVDSRQALQEVAKGEHTAAAVESQLDALESLIDKLLADAEEMDRSRHTGGQNTEPSSQSGVTGNPTAGGDS